MDKKLESIPRPLTRDFITKRTHDGGYRIHDTSIFIERVLGKYEDGEDISKHIEVFDEILNTDIYKGKYNSLSKDEIESIHLKWRTKMFDLDIDEYIKTNKIYSKEYQKTFYDYHTYTSTQYLIDVKVDRDKAMKTLDNFYDKLEKEH